MAYFFIGLVVCCVLVALLIYFCLRFEENLVCKGQNKGNFQYVKNIPQKFWKFINYVKNVPLKFWNFIAFSIILPTVDVITDIIQCVIHFR